MLFRLFGVKELPQHLAAPKLDNSPTFGSIGSPFKHGGNVWIADHCRVGFGQLAKLFEVGVGHVALLSPLVHGPGRAQAKLLGELGSAHFRYCVGDRLLAGR